MKTIKFLLAILFSIAIAACGGGGGGSNPPPPPTPATTYTISGTVTLVGAAFSGVTVNLSGASTATTTTAADGSYSFAGLANGNYSVMPSKTGNIFNPISLAVSVSGANATGKNFAATASTATTYSISGSTGITGVTVTLSGANTGSVVSGTSGAYTFSGLLAGTYSLTPSLSGYTFSPTSSPITITNANITTGANFTATAIPLPHSISGTVSGATMSGVTITVTGTATATATTNSSGVYTVPGLYDGSYTVTPSKTGFTFSPISTPVPMAGANVTGKNFTAAVNTVPTYTLSGTVSGPYVEGVTITMSGSGVGATTTNASGAYSFANLPAGTYTLTPSLTGYIYSPAAPAVAVSANTVQNFTASSTIASYSISGTVTVSTAKTGTIYLRVYNTGCTGCGSYTVAGTSIATTGGAYTIRGLQPGTYTVNAEMDALNTGFKNVGNPVGASTATAITTADVPNVNVTVANPTPPTPVTPTTGLSVNPSSGAAFIFWDTPKDANGTEIASAYKIYWSTNPDATTGGSSVTVPAHNDGLYIQSGLTNGTLYYKITALVGTTESTTPTPTIIGPVTIGATTGLNTVSGTVTYSGTATGPLYVGAYNNGGVYFTRIASPVSGGSYSIAGVPSGSYQNFAAIDMNDNGIFDAGDISNTNGNAPAITVSANTTSNLTLSSAFATATVNTDHQFDGTNHFYNLKLQVSDGTKRAVAVTLLSGLNVPVPFDLGKDWQFQLNQWLNTTVPTVGDSYLFKVTYSDGTTANISGSVTGVLGMGAMATSLAVNVATPYTRNIPQFTWAAPTTPPASYTYRVNLNGNANWYYPQDNGLPSTTLSAVYNADGRANPASLLTGTAYTWQVQVQDANKNSATFQAPPYTP